MIPRRTVLMRRTDRETRLPGMLVADAEGTVVLGTVESIPVIGATRRLCHVHALEFVTRDPVHSALIPAVLAKPSYPANFHTGDKQQVVSSLGSFHLDCMSNLAPQEDEAQQNISESVISLLLNIFGTKESKPKQEKEDQATETKEKRKESRS